MSRLFGFCPSQKSLRDGWQYYLLTNLSWLHTCFELLALSDSRVVIRVDGECLQPFKWQSWSDCADCACEHGQASCPACPGSLVSFLLKSLCVTGSSWWQKRLKEWMHYGSYGDVMHPPILLSFMTCTRGPCHYLLIAQMQRRLSPSCSVLPSMSFFKCNATKHGNWETVTSGNVMASRLHCSYISSAGHLTFFIIRFTAHVRK